MTGICGTDIHSYMHEGILFPGTVFGHETIGVVHEIGEGVDGFEIGNRVAVGPSGTCPECCFYCRNGRPSLCVSGFPRTLGIGPGDSRWLCRVCSGKISKQDVGENSGWS